MKKIFFLLMLTLFATVMVACGDDDSEDLVYSFSMTIDNYSQLRESVSIDVTLNDEAKELKNSEIRGKITKVGSESAFSNKKITFDKDSSTKEVNFTNLTADTEYVVEFYASYSGTTVTLATLNVKTSNQGTEEKPYEIDSYDDFTQIIKKDRSAYFVLVNDIDFGGKSISPMFTSTSGFSGHFDGNGKTIKNFKVGDVDKDGNPTPVKTSTQNYGLFGYITTTGVVKNVTLENFNVNVHYTSTSKAGNIGLLAGYSAGTIEDVIVKNSSLTVKGTAKTQKFLNVGGLVGNLSSQGTITGVEGVEVENTNIKVTGPIDATVGGVVGTTVNAELVTKDGKSVPNISNVKFTGGNIDVEISGATSYDATTSVGAILGRNYTAVVDNTHSTGKIKVSTSYTNVENPSIVVGGLVGWNLNHSAVLSNSTSSVNFEITTFDAPTAEGKKSVVYGGLLVGRNGGGSPSYAEVKNCSYNSTGENKINVIGSEQVEVYKGIIAFEVNEDNSINVTSNAEAYVLVQNYTFDETTKEPVLDGEATKYTFN